MTRDIPTPIKIVLSFMMFAAVGYDLGKQHGREEALTEKTQAAMSSPAPGQ